MKRLSLLSFALALPLASVACGSDDEGEGGGPVEGENYRYVVSSISAADTNKLDIDGNGTSENKLGTFVNTLSGLARIDVQGTITDSVLSGDVLLLADLQTTSFSTSANSGFSVYLGDQATTTPRPCTDETMIATCGKHLEGTGTFTIAASSPRDSLLKGSFSGGILKGGPGNITIPIAVTGEPITVNLVSARVQLSSVTADGIGKGTLGGAMLQTELDNNVFPQVHAQLVTVINRDCGPENIRVLEGGLCGRNDGTGFLACTATGAAALGTMLGLDSVRDCKLTLAELQGNTIIKTLLGPDIMIDGKPALSVALGFTAKKGTFTP